MFSKIQFFLEEVNNDNILKELYGEYEGEYGTYIQITSTSITIDNTETAINLVEIEYDEDTNIYTISVGSNNLIYDADSKELSNGGYEALTKKINFLIHM